MQSTRQDGRESIGLPPTSPSRQAQLTSADMEPEALSSGPTEKIYAPAKNDGRGGDTWRTTPGAGTDNKRSMTTSGSQPRSVSQLGAQMVRATVRESQQQGSQAGMTKKAAPVVLWTLWSAAASATVLPQRHS